MLSKCELVVVAEVEILRFANQRPEKSRAISSLHFSVVSCSNTLSNFHKTALLLDINVQLPDFADEKSGKFVAVEERNEEQQKIFKDYEKRLAKRTEEVALRRKTLQGELMQLQKDNAETAKAFDVAVQSLLMKRLEYSRHCFEVDLIQLKLAQSIVFQEERKKVARRLEQQSQVMTEKLLRASKATKAVRDELEAKKKLADELEASEKLKEKNMRSMPPFSDHEEHAELLYKLYVKRKPKKEKFGAKKEDKKAKSKPQEVEVPSMDQSNRSCGAARTKGEALTREQG